MFTVTKHDFNGRCMFAKDHFERFHALAVFNIEVNASLTDLEYSVVSIRKNGKELLTLSIQNGRILAVDMGL